MARDGYATVFPQAIGLAATWDTSLLHAVGETVSILSVQCGVEDHPD